MHDYFDKLILLLVVVLLLFFLIVKVFVGVGVVVAAAF